MSSENEMNIQHKKRRFGLLKDLVSEIVDSIFAEILWSIISFIPKMIIRLIKQAI